MVADQAFDESTQTHTYDPRICEVLTIAIFGLVR
jgi:hypothetical protein